MDSEKNLSSNLTRGAAQHRGPASTGLLSLWVGTQACAAYHNLDKAAKARIRAKVKTQFREAIHNENPDCTPSSPDAGDGPRGHVRGVTKTVVAVLKEVTHFLTVAEITNAVQLQHPSVSAYVVRRVLKKLSAPGGMTESRMVRNPNTANATRRGKVIAFRLRRRYSRVRTEGSRIQNGKLVDTIRDQIIDIIGQAAKPITAVEILDALGLPDLTLDNLYTYLSSLKREQTIRVAKKLPGVNRRVSGYVLQSSANDSDTAIAA